MVIISIAKSQILVLGTVRCRARSINEASCFISKKKNIFLKIKNKFIKRKDD